MVSYIKYGNKIVTFLVEISKSTSKKFEKYIGGRK